MRSQISFHNAVTHFFQLFEQGNEGLEHIVRHNTDNNGGDNFGHPVHLGMKPDEGQHEWSHAEKT